MDWLVDNRRAIFRSSKYLERYYFIYSRDNSRWTVSFYEISRKNLFEDEGKEEWVR
jgi:hypothetical protein